MKVNVKIKRLYENSIVPEYQSKMASGFDLHAYTGGVPIRINPGEYRLVKTGIAVSLPPGFELQVRSRSGLAYKNGIQAHFGTIDADYRGEVGVILFNFGNEPFVVQPGDRVAQGIIAQVENAHFQIVEELDTTERGTGGFGSSGVKAVQEITEAIQRSYE